MFDFVGFPMIFAPFAAMPAAMVAAMVAVAVFRIVRGRRFLDGRFGSRRIGRMMRRFRPWMLEDDDDADRPPLPPVPPVPPASGRASREAASPDVSNDARIFQLAQAKGGRLTVSDLVIATGLSVAEAEKRLQDLSDGNRVRMEVDDRGRIRFEFTELLGD
jgi:hypothetical protein